MLDIKILRTTPEVIRKDLEKRRDTAKLALFEEALQVDKEWLITKKEVDALRAKRNSLSLQISEAKKKGQDASAILKEAAEVPKLMAAKELSLAELDEKINKIMYALPNLLHESVPYGESDEQNVVVKKFGTPKTYNFPLKSHVDLLAELNLADIERAAKISGARFWFLKEEAALLDLALQQYGIDFMRKKGFTFVIPPYMMRNEPYQGVTSLGDFEEVLYKIEGEDLHPIATAEHPLTAMHMGEVFEEKDLPLKLVGLSTNFRKEAGSHGKDTKGIFRGHQFTKVEQVVLCKPEDSWKIHEELIQNAIEFFTSLGLHFQQIMQCTGDIGIVAAKKYDLEAWMPNQNTYREVVSCSNCTEYQARRLNIRYRATDGVKHIHTLNSTVVATSRAIVAIMENNQTKDGTIKIPDVLVPYMGGITEIKRK